MPKGLSDELEFSWIAIAISNRRKRNVEERRERVEGDKEKYRKKRLQEARISEALIP